MKSSASESIRNACSNLELLSRSFRLDRPGILAWERLYRSAFIQTPRRSPKTRMQWSPFFFFFFFLLCFGFLSISDLPFFRIIRISALPVFPISTFSHLRFNLCLTLKTRLNGRFSEVIALKSQFSDPKWSLLGWYSDSWANFHVWTVVLPTCFELRIVSIAFKYWWPHTSSC